MPKQEAMEELVGQPVIVEELRFDTASRDSHPCRGVYTGKLLSVRGHMIQIGSCIRKRPGFVPEVDMGNAWLNTMASTFIAITKDTSK